MDFQSPIDLAMISFNALDILISWAVVITTIAVRLWMRRSPYNASEGIGDLCIVVMQSLIGIQTCIAVVLTTGHIGLDVLHIVSPLWSFWEVAFGLSVALVWYVLPFAVCAVAISAFVATWGGRARTKALVLIAVCMSLLLIEAVVVSGFEKS